MLAHPERNPIIQAKPETLNDYIDAGCLVQVTAGSILGRFGAPSKRAAEFLLRQGWCHVIASDAHSSSGRPPTLTEAVQAAAELIGEDAARSAHDHAGGYRGRETRADRARGAAAGQEWGTGWRLKAFIWRSQWYPTTASPDNNREGLIGDVGTARFGGAECSFAGGRSSGMATTSLQDTWVRFKKHGDGRAREAIIDNYSYLVKITAGRIAGGVPPSLDREDLISAGRDRADQGGGSVRLPPAR